MKIEQMIEEGILRKIKKWYAKKKLFRIYKKDIENRYSLNYNYNYKYRLLPFDEWLDLLIIKNWGSHVRENTEKNLEEY